MNRFTIVGMDALVGLRGYSARVEAIDTTDALAAIQRDNRRVQQWFDDTIDDTRVLGIVRCSTGETMAVQSLHALRGGLTHAGNAAPWELHPTYATA